MVKSNKRNSGGKDKENAGGFGSDAFRNAAKDFASGRIRRFPDIQATKLLPLTPAVRHEQKPMKSMPRFLVPHRLLQPGS